MNAGAVGGAMSAPAIGAGSIGAAGAAAPAAAGATATAGAAAASSTPGASAAAATAPGAMSPQMQNLINMMQGLSSAEILMALMMMSGGGSDDKKTHKSNDAMSMLLGFAMAGQINQIMGDLLQSIPGLAPAGGAQAGGMSGLGGMVGGMLNVQA